VYYLFNDAEMSSVLVLQILFVDYSAKMGLASSSWYSLHYEESHLL
jgi:hypothetical protein